MLTVKLVRKRRDGELFRKVSYNEEQGDFSCCTTGERDVTVAV